MSKCGTITNYRRGCRCPRCAEAKRAQNLRNRYGMTLDDFRRMASRQNRVCAICRDRGELVVDHCHTTGVPRGLLCPRCNVGLGHFKDSRRLLIRAANYLDVSQN